MRKLYFFLLLSCFLGGLQAQVVYVNAAASGANDGSSWANAFTSLDAALATAPTGEVWIAAGVYTPDSSFTVSTALSLLGGFAGTETMASQADPATNPTILSGDQNGDDVLVDPSMNREDNTRIVYVDSLITSPVVLSGLSFVGGQTLPRPADQFINDYSGGAVLAYSPLQVNNCSFVACAAAFGSGVALLGGGTAGSTFSGLIATGNLTFNNGVIYANGSSNTTITDSEFIGNNADRGAVYFQDSPGVFVDGCTFTDNAATGPGGAIGSVRSFPVTVANADFAGNTGSTGGAIYFFCDSGSRFFDTPDDHILVNCTFTENTSATRGGAVYSVYSNVVLEGCEFTNNINANGRGGAFYAFNLLNESLIVNDCDFSGNVANAGLGGGIYTQGVVQTTVTNSRFEANGTQASTRGGAICFLGTGTATGVAMTVTMDSCSFLQNSGNSTGGAIHVQNSGNTTYFNLANSSFVGNQAGATGGAINMTSGVVPQIRNCEFNGNSSAGSGGAFSASNRLFNPAIDQDTLGLMTVENSSFLLNSAATQGGAVNIFGGLNANFINNGFYGNFVGEGGGAGGAIMMNGDSAITTTMNVVNNTFYENSAVTLADDLGLFLDPLAEAQDPNTRITAFIQNNFMGSNAGLGNIAVEDGSPLAVSLGGNLLLQEPEEGFTTPEDVVDTDTDPEAFVVNADYTSPDEADFTPNADLAGNPLINGGTSGDLVPATDFNGNPRDAMPDIGAFEVQAPALPTIVEIIANSPVHNQLEGALTAAGLIGTLNGEGPFTVFAPTDAAFAAISASNQDLLTIGDNLTNTLLTHVVSGTTLRSAITDGLVVPSLAPNTNLNFAIAGGNVTVSTPTSEVATITVVDLLASNGVVHVIDAVLIPAIVEVRNIDEAGIAVSFYPNPVADKANIRVEDTSIQSMQVNVLSVLGQRLQSWSLSNGNNVLDFSQLATGTYFLEIQIDGKTYSKVLQKQ